MTTLPRRGPGGVILSGAGVVEQDASNAALPMAAASRAFQTTTEAIGNVAETRQKMSYYEGIIREGAAEAEARRLAAEFDIALDRERFEALGGANPVPAGNLSAFGAERGKAIFDEFIGRASDELVRNRLQPRLEQTQAKWQLQIDDDARNRMVDKAKADILQTGRLLANQYHSAPSPAARATTVKALDDTLAAAKRAGIMSEEGAAVFRAKWIDAAQSDAIVAAASINPPAAMSMLDTPEFSTMDPGTKERLRGAIQADIKTADRLAKADAVEQNRRAVIDQRYTLDALAVQQAKGKLLTETEISEFENKNTILPENRGAWHAIKVQAARAGAKAEKDAAKHKDIIDRMSAGHRVSQQELDSVARALPPGTPLAEVANVALASARQIRMIPTDARRALEAALYNGSPEDRVVAASAIREMGDDAGLNKEDQYVASFISNLTAAGSSPADTAKKVDQFRQAHDMKAREQLAETWGGRKGGLSKRAFEAVESMFGGQDEGAAGAYVDAAALWEQEARAAAVVTGDLKQAEAAANDALKRGYGPSRVALGGFTIAPPEKKFSIYGDPDTDAEWIGRQINDRFNQRVGPNVATHSGETPWRDRLFLLADHVTQRALRAGMDPEYAVMRLDPDTGKISHVIDFNDIRGLAYFTPDRNKEMTRLSEKERDETDKGVDAARKQRDDMQRRAASPNDAFGVSP